MKLLRLIPIVGILSIVSGLTGYQIGQPSKHEKAMAFVGQYLMDSCKTPDKTYYISGNTEEIDFVCRMTGPSK